jgi:hypothetical protein
MLVALGSLRSLDSEVKQEPWFCLLTYSPLCLLLDSPSHSFASQLQGDPSENSHTFEQLPPELLLSPLFEHICILLSRGLILGTGRSVHLPQGSPLCFGPALPYLDIWPSPHLLDPSSKSIFKSCFQIQHSSFPGAHSAFLPVTFQRIVLATV